ncbi:MAG TPA: glycogen synthase GlgA [Candidatus Saccharimonadaceae bacterium]|jgi:starch synthase|nr:glycogen synthase GlgA [Candidatus Saccharimonadaceae bacterium]
MTRTPLTIAHLASEMAPLVKVGGLADVVGALAHEQALAGHRVVVALPHYKTLRAPAGWALRDLAERWVPWGVSREPARLRLLEPPAAGPRVLLVEHAGERRFFARDGVYDDPKSGEGYPDSAERFLFFTRAAIEGLKLLGERIDVVHAHDHQAAWAPCFMRTHEAYDLTFSGAASVFTIHNLGYQGIVDNWVLGLAGFALDQFYAGSPFEYWGRVNEMKVGLAFADAITTVSPQYAREIQKSPEFGAGLEGVLRRRSADVTGILNGIDVDVWNPATDPHLPAHYDREHLGGKSANRVALATACGWPASSPWPIVGMVSRLVEQKGFDLIEEAADDLVELEMRLVVLGSGPARYVELMRRLAKRHPERVHYREGYDEPFAHQIEAGSDLFLMPSRYEPCGLNQMYSMRYGTVPVVRAVGGLADTVTEFDPLTGEGTGFRFERFAAEDMLTALRHALALHRQHELWLKLQLNGMARDFSWRASAEGYEALYAATRVTLERDGPPTLDSVRRLMDFRSKVGA